MGLFSSWATPATSWPTEAIFSRWTSCIWVAWSSRYAACSSSWAVRSCSVRTRTLSSRPAAQLLDGLEALRAVHGQGHVIGDRREQLLVRRSPGVPARSTSREHPEHRVLDPERHHHDRADAERACGRRVDGMARALHVVHDQRLPAPRHLSRCRSAMSSSRNSTSAKRRPARRRPGHPVPAHRPARAVDQEEVGASGSPSRGRAARAPARRCVSTSSVALTAADSSLSSESCSMVVSRSRNFFSSSLLE